jgi:CBS domain containing-hemolysin-like protein
MTPRTDIDWLDIDESPEEIRRKIAQRAVILVSRYARAVLIIFLA